VTPRKQVTYYYADKTLNFDCGYCRTYCISFYASTL